MRRTIDEIRQGKYSEDVEKEKRRRMEELAEQNRKIIQEARESGRDQSGPTRPPIRPVERQPFTPPTVPEVSQAVRNTVLGRSTEYNPNQISQVAAFNAAVMDVRDDISRKKKEQETLTKNRPSMEQELEALQKKEMEWYRSEHEKGNTFGMEGYDRYVSTIDPNASTEHGKAKKRIDELIRLLTLEANPQSTEREEDFATMLQDMAEISKLPDNQQAALRVYVMVARGDMMKGGYGEEQLDAWRILPEEEQDRLMEKLMEMGAEKVKRLAESYYRYYNQAKAEETKQSAMSAMDGSTASKIGANVASIPAGILGGVTGSVSILEESMRRLFGGSQYNTMDPNLPGYALSQWAGTVRGETQRGIQESVPGFGGKALGSLYSAGMSAADNIARVALTGGTGSLALAGLGSFQSGVQEASEQGASPVRAVAMGVASGALEVLTEKVSLDQLLNTRSPESFRELLKNAAIQGGVEVSEEELSFAGNLLAEAVLLQENSKSNQAFHQYLENGMTVDEAKRAVLNDNVLEAASTAVTSFLSGGMMSMGKGAKPLLQEKRAERIRNSTAKTSQEQTAQEQKPQTGPFQNGNNQEGQSGIPHDVVNEAMQRTFRGESVDKTDTRAYPSEAFSQSEPVDKSDFGGYNSVVNRQDAVVGAEGRTYAEDNREIRYRWAVVPAEALVTSHDEFGSFNQAYPSDLQPRDRTRAASQLQISRIAKSLNPALLAESPTAQNGAPIVRGDGVVIGGNARVQAISAAYKSGSADGYAQYIRQHAQEFGLNPQDLPGNPVLVRIPTDDADWSGMAASLNNSTTSSYSASETAQNDAKNMGEVISLLNVDESGNLNAKGNREFISAFVEKVIPQADRSRVVTASGSLSQEGLARVQNAVFSYAYGDVDLLTRLTESLDNDAKNVTNALLAVAPQVARAKEAGRSGAQYDLGLSDAVTGAVRLYMEARDQGVTPVSLADQATMGDGYSSAEVAIARFLQENRRSGAQMKSFLSHLFDELEAQGSPDQESMFSGDPTIQSVVEGGMSRYESETGRSAGEFDRSYDERRGHESPAANGRKLQERENPPQQSGSGRVQAVHGGPVRSGLGEVTSKGAADGSTGAAPKGFDVYNSLQYDTGNKPDRPNDARPVNVPKRDTKGQRVSDFVANAYGAKVTPDSFIPVIEKMVTDGLVGAGTRTNRATLEQAAAEISKVGDAVMMDRISRSAESGSINEAEIAAAQLLFSKYANSDANESQDTAAKLLVDMTDMARAAGRALQLHKMLRQLTPNGQMLAVEQQISKYVDKINAKRRKKKQAKVEIPQELKTQFLEAKTADERSEIQESIYRVAASQIPSTLSEKFDALRYLAMLGNPKTHIRNVAGNAVFGRFVDVKRAVGAALEKSLPQEQRTKAVIGFGKDSRALLKWAKSDARTADIAELLSPSGTTGDKGKTKIDEYRKIFKIGALNKLSDWNANALEAEDMLFKRSSYASSLAGFLKARGYSVQDVQSGNIDPSILNEGRAYAAREAMRATFNDINAFSEAVSKFGRRDSKSAPLNAVKKVFFEGVLPFRKTPANIVVRGVEYSPAGIVRACYQYFTKVRTGEMTAAECMDTLAAGLTGTGVYALGALLSSLGVISGGSISDDEDRTGRQAYALNIGDVSITLDWLAPAAIPFFMGVETQKFMGKDYDDGMSAVTAVLYGLGSAAEPLLELSCLSSLNDIITSARYADDGKVIISALTNAAVSYFTQVLPTAFGQFDQAADKNRKMVYTTASDPVMKELQRIAGRAFQKLPGDFFQTEYIDEWGRTEDKGNLFQRVFNAFLNPAYTSKINETPADKELARLEEATGESQSPKSASRTINVPTEDGSETVRLSASQWDALARKQGSTSYDLVSAMLDLEAYKGLSDDGKRRAIESAYEYARELGKMEALPDRYTTPNTAWMVNLDGDTGEKAVAAILKRATISDVAATSEAVYDRAVEAGFSNSQMKAVFSGVSDRIKDIDQPTDYDKYRAVIDVCGKDSEKWLSVYGMTDNQLAEMKKLSTTPRQYVDALDANSRLSKAMKSVTDAWKNGETPDPSKLDEAYDFFSSLSGAKAAADPQFSSAISAYVEFRKALESSERFLVYYKKYRDISNKEGLTASERATEWAQYLDSSLLRDHAKSALLDNLSFYQTLKQDSGKYGELTDAGLHAKQAKAVSDLMKGLTPAPGKETVSTAQKIEAIHSIGMNREQEEKALRVYLSESMEKNFDKAMGYGISAGEWVELYLEYTNQKGTGKGQKNRLTQWCMQELGVDYATARALADIYL